MQIFHITSKQKIHYIPLQITIENCNNPVEALVSIHNICISSAKTFDAQVVLCAFSAQVDCSFIDAEYIITSTSQSACVNSYHLITNIISSCYDAAYEDYNSNRNLDTLTKQIVNNRLDK